MQRKKNEQNVFNVLFFLVQKQRDSHNEKGLKIYESVFFCPTFVCCWNALEKNVVLVKNENKIKKLRLFRSI